jgi:hypothetical protein
MVTTVPGGLMSNTKKEFSWGSVMLQHNVIFRGDGKVTPLELRGERLKIEISSPPRSIDGFIGQGGEVFIVTQMLDLSEQREHGFKLAKASETDAEFIRNAQKCFAG